MPEGDTIARAARRIEAALRGRPLTGVRTPSPRQDLSDWPRRLAGRRLERAESRGKHLLLRFDDGQVLHSHLGMHGAWAVHPRGARWRRSPAAAWLVLETADHEVVQFGGPTLELTTAERSRHDARLRRLGPDILGDQLDTAALIARLHANDPARTLGDTLLDQRNVAGIGNIWKSEGCFAAAVSPWRALASLTDDELERVIERTRALMLESLPAQRRPARRPRQVYRKAGRPCPRCGAPIRSRGQGDANRTTYWCEGCQA